MPVETIRIGVFLDGTGNNRFYDGPSNSDSENSASNISKMFDQYTVGRTNTTEYTKVYVTGEGTPTTVATETTISAAPPGQPSAPENGG